MNFNQVRAPETTADQNERGHNIAVDVRRFFRQLDNATMKVHQIIEHFFQLQSRFVGLVLLTFGRFQNFRLQACQAFFEILTKGHHKFTRAKVHDIDAGVDESLAQKTDAEKDDGDKVADWGSPIVRISVD